MIFYFPFKPEKTQIKIYAFLNHFSIFNTAFTLISYTVYTFFFSLFALFFRAQLQNR